MKKPERPLPTDCCGSGCTRCVYDIFEDQMKHYKAWKERNSDKENQKKS